MKDMHKAAVKSRKERDNKLWAEVAEHLAQVTGKHWNVSETKKMVSAWTKQSKGD